MQLRFDKILIVRLSALGDVINTLPVLYTLRQQLPKSFIAWVVEDKNATLLKNHPLLDKVFVFERAKLDANYLGRPGDCFNQLTHFARSLRRGKFDIALDLQGNLKSGVITYLSGAPVRVGFGKGAVKEFSHFFTNYPIDLPNPRINRVERYLTPLKGLGLDISHSFRPEQLKSLIPISNENKITIDKFLQSQHLQGTRYIIFHPGTSGFGAYKRWPLTKYAELGNRILGAHPGYQILITWGPGEYEFATEIARQMTVLKLVISCATSNLFQLAALIKKA